MKPLDNFYQKLQEPDKGCLLAMRDIILQLDEHITHELKYGMPFFCFKGKMFCYTWVHKKYKLHYLGIVEGQYIDHPQLLTEKRARMKILLLDANSDIPVSTIKTLLQQALELYRNGTIAIK
ncbi:MAG: DUF1801 domain-containing protein [Sphingobacteriales bacterium]|nr:MAG: DUF1801 domain-containing protein [Sphingobacteriales bacterium]